MADIVTNTLQIGSNNLILQDAAVRSSLANAYSASSTYAVGDMVLKDGQLYECNTAITTAEAWTAAHWTAVTVGGEIATVKDGLTAVESDVTDLKEDLYEIREPGENLCYINNFTQTYRSGLDIAWNDNYSIKIWGTAGTWVRFNCLMGNAEIATSSYPTYTNNLSAGTYTLNADDLLYVFYGTSWETRTRWENGTSITLENAVCVYLSTKTNSQAFGTEQEPSVFHIAIYHGNVNVVPTAKDTVAREQITKDLGDLNFDRVMTKGDFDYERPYNIFNGTTWTKDKKVDYLDGTLADNAGTCVTDYMEIDNTKGYLCLNIYVVLAYEQGLATGGNRVWIHSNWAFYDANKGYIRTNSAVTDTSKIIPTNAKYVRLTASSEAIIPFVVLFYGQYTSQQWVRYTEYRKQIIQYPVFSATGMEKLNMVMFGDSITQGVESTPGAYFSYVDYANDILRSNIINCGLGGSRMSQGLPDAIGLGSFASLCENIASDDQTAWDALDAYASATHPDWVYHINDLKSVDWDGIQAVGIFYGANDWHNNVPVGTEYNEDPTKYDGACAYGLKKLLTKYPHLQAIVFTPIYRETDGTNSDVPNGAGLNMDDYGASLKNVQTVFHCPVVDMGNEININRFTIYSYTATSDGTHPRKLLGLERIGRFIAESVKRYIQPY